MAAQRTPPESLLKAREWFPRGLAQPETGFRFSMDGLLLASFAPLGPARAVDLGCGCGVIGLAWLLRHQTLDGQSVLGLDLDGGQIESALENGRRLGFEQHFSALSQDLRELAPLEPESADLALANPPYRDPESGRTSPDAGRLRARFEDSAGLDDFCRAAFRVLRNRARLCMIHLAEHLPRVLAAMSAAGLEPKRLCMVHSRLCQDARLTLVEGRKNGGPGMVVEPPLILYGQGENSRKLTDEALAFCPFLACNAGRDDIDKQGSPTA